MIGGLVTFGFGGRLGEGDAPTDARGTPSPSLSSPEPVELVVPTKRAPTTMLAWTASGIPASIAASLSGSPGVAGVVRVVAGIDWIAKTVAEEGTVIDQPSGGRFIPLDIAVVPPTAYSAFVKPSERQLIRSLDGRSAVLSVTGAELRRARAGMKIYLRDRTVTVVGIVSDDSTGGYEALVGGAVPGSWTREYPFLLVALERASARAKVGKRVERMVGAGTPLQLRAQGETPFLRYGDSVLSEAYVKVLFGEFSAIPLPDGTLDVDPAYRADHIITAPVPILGEVTCNRAIFPALRRVMRQIINEGLEHIIDPADFGGCYSPRTIISGPGARLSHHAYGIGFDLNVSENAYARQPRLDPRIVKIFEANDFTWGGRWLVPDGMHFEWNSFPAAD